MLEKLKTLNKEEADELYEQYLESNNTIEDTSENFTDEEWKIANKFLNKYDLELWYLARGTCIIKEVPDFYYKTFKDYVTDDYKEYLKITSKENEEHYVADSGLCITLEELGDRIARWKNFLNKYPNSTLKPKVTALLNSYREDYLLGMENTPTRDGGYDGQPFTICEENMKEFNRFMEKYPNSSTVELIKYFLENYQNDNIQELIQNKIKKDN